MTAAVFDRSFGFPAVETRYPIFMRLFVLALVLCSLASPAPARPKTHDAAVSVLGQVDLASEAGFNPPTASSFDNADGVAIDPTTGKLFVSDSENHRILRFSAVDAYRTNAPAEAVFGQADFVSQSANRGQVQPAANTLSNPSSLCCDAEGRLWVCDYNNARVLRFDGASSKASGAAADGVIGQPGFTTRVAATSQVADGGFENPSGIAVDAAGNLWVADASLPRILRFDAAAALGGRYMMIRRTAISARSTPATLSCRRALAPTRKDSDSVPAGSASTRRGDSGRPIPRTTGSCGSTVPRTRPTGRTRTESWGSPTFPP